MESICVYAELWWIVHTIIVRYIQVDLRTGFAIFSSPIRIHSIDGVVVVVVIFFSPPKPFICSSLFYRNRWTFSNALQSTTTIRSTGTWIGRNINGPTAFTMHKTMVALWNVLYTHIHTHTRTHRKCSCTQPHISIKQKERKRVGEKWWRENNKLKIEPWLTKMKMKKRTHRLSKCFFETV